MNENPVPVATQKQVREALYGMSVARQLIDQAQAAGIPCDEADARCTHYKELLTKFEQTYCEPCSKPGGKKR